MWHVEEPYRLTKRYFRSWHFRHGRTDIIRQPATSKSVCYFGIPRFLLRRLVSEVLRWAWYMVTMRPNGAFLFQLRAIHLGGQVIGRLNVWRRNRKGRSSLRVCGSA